jgi:hypothetical protein
MWRIVMLLVLAVILEGCAATFDCNRFVGQERPAPLKSGCSVYVSTPKNGWYGDEEGEHSGEQTAHAIAEAFSNYTPKVEVEPQFASAEENLDKAAAGQFAYFVDPAIVHWEERATEWSGKPDRITIQITLYDVPEKRIIDRVTIKGTSKWATFGGDHPQDLLKQPINKYVAELFGVAHK